METRLREILDKDMISPRMSIDFEYQKRLIGEKVRDRLSDDVGLRELIQVTITERHRHTRRVESGATS